jgi:Helicase conserved C-terminal domain
MNNEDLPHIEDYLQIVTIIAAASRENFIRHVSPLHLWWAKRPPAMTAHQGDAPLKKKMFDKEVTRQQIQSLNDIEAITAFFAYLGFDTNSRIQQTPGNLGITTETVQRQIKRIERIADQQGLLSVYLIEMTSVTVAGIQGIITPLRNRAGQYLFLLTSDYEQVDFVLLQRVTPEGEGKGLTQKQVGVRPRVLTVDRRNPDPVALRVLRRFSYSELDPFAQFDKLVSAFGVAEWSEPLFNNRALFSDYYLKFRLPDDPAWKDDPKPAYQKFLNLFAQAPRRWGGQSIKEVSEGLLEPAFLLLGFSLKKDPRDSEGSPNPHYHLQHPQNKHGGSLAVCLTYPWGRSLNGKDEARDKDKRNENPGQIVVSLLEKGEAPWAIVTNGKHWRLYSAKAHSRAMNYYEIDLEETLSAADPSEIFRYFWLHFREEAFEVREVLKEGERRKASFLDLLFEGSEEYARELGERLKERVFEEIFPHFARGFIEDIRRKEANVELNQEALDKVFQGTLTFLYRLLFLLYAEARDLFPVKEVRGYWEKSLSKLKEEVSHAAKKVQDEAPENLKKAYEKNSTLLYDRLSELFRIIDRGDLALNVPLYNGGLFLTNPDVEDLAPEAQSARFLLSHKIPDQFLALGLDLMATDLDNKRQDLAFIDYRSLGVRQLGSIYEGLLEFKLRVAPEKMAVVKGKKTEEVVPYREAQKEDTRILTKGRGHFKDTARYLYRALIGDSAGKFRQKIGNPHIRRMDSGASPKERTRIIETFAPRSNRRADLVGSDDEIDILISTDVLSEGQNLQDCGHLVNYDLHWNPTRMVQRAGRIDRIGAKFDTLQIYNMFPDEGLERLLRLLESLMQKISNIDRTGFPDASVLGEVVHPQSFNTLRRIRDEDNSVIEEEEGFMELASNEFLLQHLRQLLEAGGVQMLEELPDGIHSGLIKPGAKGVFFYFVAPSHEGGRLHFWRYYDLRDGRIMDNRYLIANYIHCEKETSRVIPDDVDIFEIQERIIEHILKSEKEKVAIEAAPKIVDPAQQLVATAIQEYLHHPEMDRNELVNLISFISRPLPRIYGRKLREFYKEFSGNKDIVGLVEKVNKIRMESGKVEEIPAQKRPQALKKEDLHLICFDYLSA